MTFENIPLLFLSAMNSPFALPRLRLVFSFIVVSKTLNKKLYSCLKFLFKITKQSFSLIFHLPKMEQFNFFQKIMSKSLAERLRSRDPENFSYNYIVNNLIKKLFRVFRHLFLLNYCYVIFRFMMICHAGSKENTV